MYFDSIWKGRKDDDQMGVCGETEEEARQNTANYTQIPKKPFAPSPWKDARLTSCEMEYDRGEFRGCRLECPKFGCLAKRHSVCSLAMRPCGGESNRTGRVPIQCRFPFARTPATYASKSLLFRREIPDRGSSIFKADWSLRPIASIPKPRSPPRSRDSVQLPS